MHKRRTKFKLVLILPEPKFQWHFYAYSEVVRLNFPMLISMKITFYYQSYIRKKLKILIIGFQGYSY